MLTCLAKLLSMFSALCALESIEIRRNINAMYSIYTQLIAVYFVINHQFKTVLLFYFHIILYSDDENYFRFR